MTSNKIANATHKNTYMSSFNTRFCVVIFNRYLIDIYYYFAFMFKYFGKSCFIIVLLKLRQECVH